MFFVYFLSASAHAPRLLEDWVKGNKIIFEYLKQDEDTNHFTKQYCEVESLEIEKHMIDIVFKVIKSMTFYTINELEVQNMIKTIFFIEMNHIIQEKIHTYDGDLQQKEESIRLLDHTLQQTSLQISTKTEQAREMLRIERIPEYTLTKKERESYFRTADLEIIQESLASQLKKNKDEQENIFEKKTKLEKIHTFFYRMYKETINGRFYKKNKAIILDAYKGYIPQSDQKTSDHSNIKKIILVVICVVIVGLSGIFFFKRDWYNSLIKKTEYDLNIQKHSRS